MMKRPWIRGLLCVGLVLLASGRVAYAQALESGANCPHFVQMAQRFSTGNRWEALAPELLREWVWPQTSLGEEAVDWFPVLAPLAEEITAKSPTPLAAARALNQHLWARVGVRYSPKREKANQDPLHSIRLGMASCSGLSILLIDACRSVGIPARLVGCFWRTKPGNHSWVEVSSGGRWFPFGAAEDCEPEALWFLSDAAEAVADDPRYAIYAARATLPEAGTRFYGWGVPAENITARYARSEPHTAVRVFIAAERHGARVSVPFRVNGTTYYTPGPERDLNDYATLSFPSNGLFFLEIEGRTLQRRATPGAIYVEQLL